MVCKILMREHRVPHDLALLRIIFLIKPHAITSLIKELTVRSDLLLKLIL